MPASDRERLTIRIARFLVRWRYLCLFLVAATTVCSVWFMLRVRFIHNIEVWFNEKDPKIGNYRWYKKTFPSDEIVLVTYDADAPFSPKAFKLLQRLTRRLEQMTIDWHPPLLATFWDGLHQALHGERPTPFRPFVQVTSLANVKVAVNHWMEVDDEASGPPPPSGQFWVGEPDESAAWEQVFKVASFVPRAPRTRHEAAYLLRRAKAMARFRNTLISAKGDHVAVICTSHVKIRDFWHKGKIYQGINAITDALSKETGTRFYAISMPFFGLEARRLNRIDQGTLFPAMIIMVVITLILLFRTFSGVAIPLAVVLFSVVFTRGIMGLAHIDDTILAGILPALLLAVCVADMVHYYSEYLHQLRQHRKREAIIQALGRVMKPCFYTSMTTAAGFGSLMASDISVIGQFGLLAAIGVSFAFLLSTIALPICLDVLRQPRGEAKRVADGHRPRALAVMTWISHATQAHPRVILWGSLLVVAVSTVGVFFVNLETSDSKLLRKDNQMRIAMNTVSRHLSSAKAIEIVVDTGRAGGAKDPAFLRKLEAFQRQVGELPAVKQSVSLATFVKEFHGVFMGGDAGEYRIPKTRPAVEQLLAQMGDMQEMGSYADFTYRYARVHIRVKELGTKRVQAVYDQIEAILAKQGVRHDRDRIDVASKTPGPRFMITGMGSLGVRIASYVLSSQIKSFSLALLVIFLMMVLQLRSWRLGILSMVPNIFPIFLYLGLMGFVGINLDVGTAMIASVAIGISVDDTIHFMERHRERVLATRDYHRGTLETLREVGVAIVLTSVILFVGFATLIFGQFTPIIYFGLLTSITMVSALYADLFLLPVLLAWRKPYRLGPKPSGTAI